MGEEAEDDPEDGIGFTRTKGTAIDVDEVELLTWFSPGLLALSFACMVGYFVPRLLTSALVAASFLLLLLACLRPSLRRVKRVNQRRRRRERWEKEHGRPYPSRAEIRRAKRQWEREQGLRGRL